MKYPNHYIDIKIAEPFELLPMCLLSLNMKAGKLYNTIRESI